MNLLSEIDFRYRGIEIEYDYITNCSQYGCYDEGICRCSEIHNDTITDIELSRIVNRIYENYYNTKQTIAEKRDSTILEVLSGVGKDVNLYCIDRIVKHFKLWNKDYYNIEKEGGYYGQEIRGVFLHDNIAKKVEKEIDYVNNLTSFTEKIEYLLLLEYDTVLPKLSECTYEIKEVEKSKIVFGSVHHHKRVKEKSLEFYSDDSYDNIRGIAIQDGDTYRLIDGYHRTHTTKKPYVKLIVAKR